MELRHMRYFVAVVEERGFTRAAERLQIAQSPLSQQIRKLERELGVQLLTRTSRTLELTPAGTAFYQRARVLLDGAEEATDTARRVSRGEIGRLSVGFTGSATYELFPALVRAYQERHPGVTLHPHTEMFTAAQADALLDGTIDIGGPPASGARARVGGGDPPARADGRAPAEQPPDHRAAVDRTRCPAERELRRVPAITAYQVQCELRSAAGPLAGWKLGVISQAKQAQVGVSDPVYGFLAAADAVDLGQPLDTSRLIQPRCEPEIVFVLGRDLTGPHVTAADVIAASSGIAVGIEVLDSRYTDYTFTMADVVADNTSAGRYVVGTPVTPQSIDLRLVGVVLEKNGTLVATASGAAALGHPAAAVSWLARRLSAAGEGLRAGEIVLSGGLTAAVPVSPGDVVVASIDRLGSVELACR